MGAHSAAAALFTGVLAFATLVRCNTEGDILYEQRQSWKDPNNGFGVSRSIRRLHGNNLTGTIPQSLGNLTNLIRLELQKNSLSGSIPASLGNIKTLEFLRLNGNSLTGTVPLEVLSLVLVGNLTEMCRLALTKLRKIFACKNDAGNNLDGTVGSTGLRGQAEDHRLRPRSGLVFEHTMGNGSGKGDLKLRFHLSRDASGSLGRPLPPRALPPPQTSTYAQPCRCFSTLRATSAKSERE
ncbi:hypothetical protein E2562_004867 [Oryza meyeriana var. granulata]|uniref:non-specific serine/threonine protein kinase n=1 Tax=Oryza meyeriana var. granulata TaxID=110450 RepID=A0A6G1C2H2_9ORYZ|nr:hypothetical protein E2562_004867 [Oryza meyeriana var. granulata]